MRKSTCHETDKATLAQRFEAVRAAKNQSFAVGQDVDAGLLAVEKLLDDDTGACFAHLVAGEHVADGHFGLAQVLRDHDALAGGEAVGLDDDRRTLGVDVGVGGGGVGEDGQGLRPSHAGLQASEVAERRRRPRRDPRRRNCSSGAVFKDGRR